MSSDKLKTLRILNPYPGIYAYYDGRTGTRFHSEKPNWLDDGAFTLGVATYAIVSGDEALVFDAHITTEHAAAVLRHVQNDLGVGVGAGKITMVYSHAHGDHIAGAEAFRDHGATIIGSEGTAEKMESGREKMGKSEPPITPVLPTRTFSKQLALRIGDVDVELHSVNIHTSDSSILWLPAQGLLFAGDIVEDTATFMSEVENLAVHRQELQRVASTLPIDKILPAHGDADQIAAGGYDPSLIAATLRYLAAMDEATAPDDEPVAWTQTLAEVVAGDVAEGNLIYYEQYEEVHKENVDAMRKLRQKAR